jgi:hypothetical protein
MYIYIYIYMYYTHAHTHTHAPTHPRTHLHTHTHTQVYANYQALRYSPSNAHTCAIHSLQGRCVGGCTCRRHATESFASRTMAHLATHSRRRWSSCLETCTAPMRPRALVPACAMRVRCAFGKIRWAFRSRMRAMARLALCGCSRGGGRSLTAGVVTR